MISPHIINDFHCMRLKSSYQTLLEETKKTKNIFKSIKEENEKLKKENIELKKYLDDLSNKLNECQTQNVFKMLFN